MKIRNYRSSDLGQCQGLWAEMVQRHRDIYEDPSIGGESPGVEFVAHLERVGQDRVWVAEEEGNVVGLFSLSVEDQQAEVEPIIISSTHRNVGLGKRLLRFAIAEAEDLGAVVLSVKPVARNVDAIRFFHRSGFTTVGHVQLFMWLGPSTPGQWKPGPKLFGLEFSF